MQGPSLRGGSDTQPADGGSVPMLRQLEIGLSPWFHFLLGRSGAKHSFLDPQGHEAITSEPV